MVWEVIAVELGKGAVSWAAGKALSSMFDKGESFATLIPFLLQEIDSTIQRRLEEQTLREIQMRASGAEDQLRFFLNAPDQIDRLEHATQDMTNAVRSLSDLGLLGHRSFMLANSVLLSISSLRKTTFSDEAEVQNMKLILQSGISHHDRLSGHNWNLPPFALSEETTTNPESAFAFDNWKANQNWLHIAIHPMPIYESHTISDGGGGIPPRVITRRVGTQYRVTDAGWSSHWIQPNEGGAAAAMEVYGSRAASRWNEITIPNYVSASDKIASQWRHALENL